MQAAEAVQKCYCGFSVELSNCISHYSKCPVFREESKFYRIAHDLIQQNPEKIDHYKRELIAVLQSSLFNAPESSNSVRHAEISQVLKYKPDKSQLPPNLRLRDGVDKIPRLAERIDSRISEEEDRRLAESIESQYRDEDRRLAERIDSRYNDEKDRKLAELIDYRENFLVRYSDSLTCQLCQKANEDSSKLIFLNCMHFMCSQHLIELAEEEMHANDTLKCPIDRCTYLLSQTELKEFLKLDELGLIDQRVLAKAGVVRCPSCKCFFDFEPGIVDEGFKDAQGKYISKEAAQHMSKYRMRCICKAVSCVNCQMLPYHLGMNCEEARNIQVNSCIIKENVEWSQNLCSKTLMCGHSCNGIKGETQCGGCLKIGCADSRYSESDPCLICQTNSLGEAPCVWMTCGHVIHYHCLLMALENGYPGPRITFNFAKCLECYSWIHVPYNPTIADKMQTIIEMYNLINTKAKALLVSEGRLSEFELLDPSAIDSLSYYMCFNCNVPYFGGNRNCENDLERGEFVPEELVCPSCSFANSVNSECKIHGINYIVYKCKFCCKVAELFCWGNTHFCEDCHNQQKNGDYLNRKSKDELPECPGRPECLLEIEHESGQELALGCSLCSSLIDNTG